MTSEQPAGCGRCSNTLVVFFQVYYDGALVASLVTNSNSGIRNTVIWLGTNNGKDGDPYTFGSCWLDNFYIWQSYIPDEKFIIDQINS